MGQIFPSSQVGCTTVNILAKKAYFFHSREIPKSLFFLFFFLQHLNPVRGDWGAMWYGLLQISKVFMLFTAQYDFKMTDFSLLRCFHDFFSYFSWISPKKGSKFVFSKGLFLPGFQVFGKLLIYSRTPGHLFWPEYSPLQLLEGFQTSSKLVGMEKIQNA